MSAITAAPVRTRIADRRDMLPLMLILLAWVGTYFPWSFAGIAAFNANLYDLAEWSSLNPVVRAEPLPLLATFCLRAMVGLLAVLLTVQAAHRPWRSLAWGLRGLALLIAVGLLPPLDFFRGQFNDPNYQQQAIIATISTVAVVALWRLRRRDPEGLPLLTLTRLVSWFALIGGIVGEVLALNALGTLGLHVTMGGGLLLTLTAVLLRFGLACFAP